MIKVQKGVTRIVFLIGNYAFKIPNLSYSHKYFLQGCYNNWAERDYYKKNINAIYDGNLSHYAAPSLFCSWFGFIQIQYRCQPCNRDLTEHEKEFFNSLCWADNKKENFGYYKGKLVCLDYPRI